MSSFSYFFVLILNVTNHKQLEYIRQLIAIPTQKEKSLEVSIEKVRPLYFINVAAMNYKYNNSIKEKIVPTIPVMNFKRTIMILNDCESIKLLLESLIFI